MDTYLVTLKPRGPCASAVTSNTLFGAVCWALQTLRLVNVADLLADFSAAPHFVFSSAFPFAARDGNVVRCFPKPMITLPTAEQIYCLAEQRAKTTDRTSPRFKRRVEEITDNVKQIKNAKYVSHTLFSEICAGQWDSPRLLREWNESVCSHDDTLWLKKDLQALWGRNQKPDDLWRTTGVQRNSVDRVAGATAEGLLFYEVQTFFRRGQAGLWCLTLASQEARQWLEVAFRYLSDTGIGGKRTVGKGHFECIIESAEGVLPQIADPDSFVVLSRYLPTILEEGQQLEAEPLGYTLLPVYQRPENKFPGSEQMRAHSGRIHLFTEGSVFALQGAPRSYYGRITPLCRTNGRTIYYSGLAIPVPAKLGGAK